MKINVARFILALSSPYALVVRDPQGNSYGTTFEGGLYGYGVVFKLTP
jgi:uncharacterized repeat protein (TIGR03803 family)